MVTSTHHVCENRGGCQRSASSGAHHGLSYQRRKVPRPNFDDWWKGLCRVLQLDYRSTPYEAELVKVRTQDVEGHMILLVHLNWQPARCEVQFYEHTAWQYVCISEFARLDPVDVSVLCGNIQGLHRTRERPVTKWDELVHVMAIGDVTVLLVQEAWASMKKPSKRSPEGF